MTKLLNNVKIVVKSTTSKTTLIGLVKLTSMSTVTADGGVVIRPILMLLVVSHKSTRPRMTMMKKMPLKILAQRIPESLGAYAARS